MDMNGGAPVTGFIFPILKPSEIQQCMTELGTELTNDELNDPAHHKEKLRKIFTFLVRINICKYRVWSHFLVISHRRSFSPPLPGTTVQLEVCAGKREEDFLPTPTMLEAASMQPYPELHQEFNEMQFYTCLRDLMTMAGYASFSWRDIHCPTPKRLRYQLSAIINLAKYREEQLRVYAELNEPRIALIQALDDVNAENAELQEQEQQVTKESKEHFHELEQVMRECEELEMEISRNNKLQAAARNEATEIKKTANDLKDQVATAVWALQEAEAEEEKLRSKIVSSPDRRKSDLMIRKERLRKVKDDCDQLETSIQSCRTKVANAMQAVRDLDTTNTLLDDLQEQANTHKELVRKTEESRKRYQSMQKKNEMVEKQIEEVTWQLARSEETRMQQRKQHTLQMDAVLEALEEAKSVLLRVERERREGIARIEAGEAEVQTIANLMDREREQNDADINAMIQEYKLVEEAFLHRNQSRMDAIMIHPP